MTLDAGSLEPIEEAFARRLPATLSILLEGMAVQLERLGDPRSEKLRLAASTAYGQRVDEARALFDAALAAGA